MVKRYNFIYEKLVDGPDDIVGLIAYGIYKRQKISFIAEFKKKNGNDPNDNELLPLHDTWCQHVELYKLEAEQKLRDAHETLYGDQISQMEKDYQSALAKETVQAQLDASKGKFWSNVWAGLTSGLMILAFLGVLSLAFFGFNFDWSKPAKAIADQIQKQEVVTPPPPPEISSPAKQ